MALIFVQRDKLVRVAADESSAVLSAFYLVLTLQKLNAQQNLKIIFLKTCLQRPTS